MTNAPRPDQPASDSILDTSLSLELLTSDDLCALLKVRKSWVYDQVQAGRLPHLRLGNQLRFSRSQIAAYLERLAD